MLHTAASRIKRNLLLAGYSFFVCLGIAIVMNGGAFRDNRGISFFGAHWATAVPYAAGFLLCDFFLLKAAESMDQLTRPPFPWLGHLTRILALLLLGILATPDSINAFFALIHVIAAFLLFAFEFGFAIWIVLRWSGDLLSRLLLLGLFGAGLTAMLSEFHLIYYLGGSSLLFQIFFMTLFVHSITRLVEQPTSAPDRQAAGLPVIHFRRQSH